MPRIVSLLFFLFFLNKVTAANKDTIYYAHSWDVSYDTIPYMLKDQYFLEGLNELKMMLYGNKPYSLKRAEFIVEWAYSGGTIDYSKFCHDIDSVTYVLRRFIEINKIQQYKTAPNFALFEYFTKQCPMNGNKAFTYDFNDFTGRKDFRNLFITKVMETHTGQCTSLPLYYKILCDELGGQSALAFAPKHMYVKHIGEDGKWVNIELTNGHFVRDEWIIQTNNVSTEAIRNGIFLTALTDKENVAFMIAQLGKAYQQKYNSWDYFPLRCAEDILNVLPKFCDALVLKFCVHQQLGYAYLSKYGQTRSRFSDFNYSEFQRMITTLDSLGYSQQTDEEYEQSVKKALNNINSTK